MCMYKIMKHTSAHEAGTFGVRARCIVHMPMLPGLSSSLVMRVLLANIILKLGCGLLEGLLTARKSACPRSTKSPIFAAVLV